MGVHGLWQLLHPAGRPVTLESLEGKVLAVDVSLWLHQTMKGMRDKDGNPLPNAHLQGLFSRVCKLLFYRIKPIFVFDGDVPALKKQTLVARRERKAQAEREGHEIAQKLLRNLVKSEAVKNALGDTSKAPARVPGVKKGGSNRGDKDIFELPPLRETDDIRLRMNAEEWEQQFEQQENWIREGMKVLSDVRPDSAEFKSMPMEIQHEVLNDMKERQKYHSLRQMTQMPEDSDNFSAYQLKKLMKQCNLTTEIESVRKRMAKKTVDDLQLESDEKYTGDEVEAGRIVSEEASHYILIKGMSKQMQEEHADRYELESRIKKEKEDDLSKFKGALGQTASQTDDKAEKGKPSSSLLGTKRSFTVDKTSGSYSKRAKRARPGRKDHSKDSDELRASVAGNGDLNNEESLSWAGNDEDVDSEGEKDLESVEEMSSEDEGFIEVAFDPTQMMQEDELFPASIFTPVTDADKEKEHSEVKGHAVVSDVISGQSSQSRASVKANSVTISRDTKPTEIVEGSGESKVVRGNNVSATPNVEDDSESNSDDGKCSPLPKSSNAEKRKTVLNDILSQLKKKKEEVLLLGDAEETFEGDQVKSSEKLSGGTRQEDEEEGCEDSTVDIGHSRDSQKSRLLSHEEEDHSAEPEYGNNSTLLNTDSGSEDEDLKLAIQLSLQTAKAEQETSENRINEEQPIQSDVHLTHGNSSDEITRHHESDEDNDSEVAETDLPHLETDEVEKQDIEAEQNLSDSEKEKEYTKTSFSLSGFSGTTHESLPPISEESIEERLQPEDFEIETSFPPRNQCFAEDLTGELEAERNALLLEQGKQARFARSVTEQVTLEAQELLRLFGIPYIVSPMEAEAQCAYLDDTEQTQGTITDDSDIWLFGGKRMYKNFFNQNKHVEFFSIDGIVSHFGLKRQQLINIALLCGSDYTEGIESVGPVRALEILGEFPGDGLNGLRDFRNWWDRARKNPFLKETNKLRSRISDLAVIRGFPSQAVVDAYMSPVVDESKESFTWGQPDLDLLRQFAKLKFGWSREKSDQSLEPMMKQLLKRQTQGRIYSYFQQDTYIPSATATAKSSRLEKALLRVQESEHVQAQNEEDEERPQSTLTNKKKSLGKNSRQESESVEEHGTAPQKKNVKKRKKEQLEKDTKRKQNVALTETSNEKEKAKSLSVEVKEEVNSESEDQRRDDNLPSASMEIEDGDVKAVSCKELTKSKGKGRGNQSMRVREKRSIPNLSLETKRRGTRSQKPHSKKPSLFRPSVCLSESSSDSDSPEESKPVKSEKPEPVKRQQKPTTNVMPSKSQTQNSKSLDTRKKVSCDKEAQGEERPASNLSPVDNSSITVRKSSQSTPVHNTLRADLKSKKTTSNENIPLPVTNPSKEPTRRKNTRESIRKSNAVKKSVSNTGNSPQPDAQTQEIHQIEKEHLIEEHGNALVGEEVDSWRLTYVEARRDLRSTRTKESKEKLELRERSLRGTSQQVIHPEEEEDDEEHTLPKQVVKNPDVSLINAETLKATLTYLNRRSGEKKQLLNSLKGGHRLNAVERRIAEEEKRERIAALIRAKKEQSNVKKQEENTEPKQEVSFEDMLGGMDAEIVKSRAGKGKTRPSLKGKAAQNCERAEEQPQPLSDNQRLEKQPVRALEKTMGAAKRQRRMRSMSSDSSSSVDFCSKQGEAKDQKKENKSEIDSEVKDQRSERSKFFDQPIDQPISGSKKSKHSTVSLEDHDPPSPDKFQYQMHHMNDSRSVKGHGYVPYQLPPEKVRGLAIAGKGKGIGKNRNGRKAGNSGNLARPENMHEKSHAGIQVSGGVTTDQIQEHANITVDDLGSDFSDSEF